MAASEENEQNSALRFEPPLWFAAASRSRSADPPRPSPVIDLTKTRGINSDQHDRDDAGHDLHDVLTNIDPGTEILQITGDTPTNEEWEALGRHFTNVRALEVDTGWDECWVDGKFPLAWPLKLLVIAGACGQAVATPAIIEGRIEHLVLMYTCSLRFEGPSTRDLMKKAEVLYAIPRSCTPDKQGPTAETAETDADRADQKIKVYSVDHEWRKWLDAKYDGKEIAFSSACEADPPSRMRKLEILGNDAVEMLTWMAIAKFHLLVGLESLAIHSIDSYDLTGTPGIFFVEFLPVLNLKSLKLALGSVTLSRLLKAAGNPHGLHQLLPKSLETLHFRGPVSMASQLDQFSAAFADSAFLPSLKRISFVLDLPGPGTDDNEGAPLEQLTTAKIACGKLLRAAAKRGVGIDEYDNPWAHLYPHFFKIDDRWAEVDDGLSVEETAPSL
ncbi:hypothetical protein MFIFM68171_05457 [Madurella fahalii]|uniref:Uncharacterized protein n=1 Tax=Madurella fahalii TaxID=1157608 RepID=A0ABQ0GBV1_9PEZI